MNSLWALGCEVGEPRLFSRHTWGNEANLRQHAPKDVSSPARQLPRS